jgi:hypothetical protein
MGGYSVSSTVDIMLWYTKKCVAPGVVDSP